jgi:hypothetical protein
MRQTLFLGVAAILDAIGSFLASIHHLYTAYGCFAVAIVLVIVAVLFHYRDDYRLERGKRKLGEVLMELSQAELGAHEGTNSGEYDKLLARIDVINKKISVAAQYLDDSSIESRFHSVNVYDIELNEATKVHFISRGQGNFWTVYQKVKAQRICVEQLLRELRRG